MKKNIFSASLLVYIFFLLTACSNDGEENNGRGKPAIDPTEAQSVSINDIVTLDAGTSSDVENTNLTYSWSFVSKPEGSNASLTEADTEHPSFKPDVAGVYVVQLVVMDGEAERNPVGIEITASQLPFIGNILPAVNCDEEDRINLDLDYQIDGTPVLSQAAKGGGTHFIKNTDLPSGCYLTQLQLNIPDEVQLTIAPDTIMMFANESAGLSISGGSIIAQGTQTSPIYFTGDGDSSTKNKWAGIRIAKRNMDEIVFDFTVIEHAGSGSFLFENAAFSISTSDRVESPRGRLTFTNNVIRHVESNGRIKYAFTAQKFGYFKKFSNNTIYNNDVAPISITFNEVQFIENNNRFSYNGEGNTSNKVNVVKPRSRAVLNTLESDSANNQNKILWQKQKIPYLVKDDVRVVETVLEIEAGTIIEFEENVGLFLESENAGLSAIGTSSKKIKFTKNSSDILEESTLGWRGIHFINSNADQNKLDHVIVEYGGVDETRDANLVLIGNSNVAVSNSYFSNSPTGYGIYIDDLSSLSKFTNNIIRLNQKGGGLVAVSSLQYLDSSSDYDNDNANNYIEVLNPGDNLIGVTTLPNINTAYTFKRHFVARGQIVIEPGAVLLFDENIKMEIQSTLSAIGTAEKPIIFSSLSALDSSVDTFWTGLIFSGGSGYLDYVTIEKAGFTNSGSLDKHDHAGLRLNSGVSSSQVEIENSTIKDLDENAHAVYIETHSTLVGNLDSSNIPNPICHQETEC